MAEDKNKINKDASIKKEALNQPQKEQISVQENKIAKPLATERETKVANSKNVSQSEKKQENLANTQEVSESSQANKLADASVDGIATVARKTTDNMEKKFDKIEEKPSKIEEDQQINVKNKNNPLQKDKGNLKNETDSVSKEKNAEETKGEKSKSEVAAQLDAAKELISAARSAINYGHFDTAFSKLSQASSIIANNPLLKGMESSIQNVEKAITETQSRYMSEQNNLATGMGILSEEEAKKLHESLQVSSVNYYGSEEKKKEVTDARKKIVDGENIQPGALQMYANHCIDVDKKDAKEHMNNTSGMIGHYQSKIAKGTATEEEKKACDKLIEEKSGIEIDLKVQKGFKELAKKEIGKDDKESVKKHICGKCETEQGREEVKEVVRKANGEQKKQKKSLTKSAENQIKSTKKVSLDEFDSFDDKENPGTESKLGDKFSSFKKSSTTTYEKGGIMTPPHTPPKTPNPPGKGGPSK